jgi:hypothetical protein
MNELERENARLRSELNDVRQKRFEDRDAIRSLLSNGQLLDIADVRARIAAGDPHLPQLLELEREMAEAERSSREAMSDRIPFHTVIEHAERLNGAVNG